MNVIGGSAIADEYQRMCRDINVDFRFGGMCEYNIREPEERDAKTNCGGEGFNCYRAEVEYDFAQNTFCDCGPFR